MTIGNYNRLVDMGNAAQVNDIVNLAVVNAAANVYTLDLAKSKMKNFKITSADANAKSIVLGNVDTTANLIVVNVLITFTTLCSITHPTGVTFAGGTPTYSANQSYDTSYVSIDGGTTWAGYSVRRT